MLNFFADYILVAAASFILGYFLVALFRNLLETRKLPPGPWGLPIVGYAPFLGEKPHVKLCELSKKYGSVISLRLGNRYVVFLNDWQSIKDALGNDAILGRPKSMLGEGFLLKQRNLTVESGHIWREQRRFAFRVFRDLGFGKQVMEESIKDEIGYLLNEIEKNNENPINMHELLMPSVSNNICSLIFGHRYDYNDPIRKRLNILFPRILELLEVSSVSTFLPFVYKAMQLFGSSRMTELMSLLHEFESIVEKEVEIHQKDARNDVNDYIDAFLREMHEREKLNKDMGSFSFQRLYSNSKGFFIAGSFTTRNTLDWILKLIAAYPDVQKCVHDEIDAVIGHNRLPAWSDRQIMPYTQAVIMESQRWCCVVPLNIPRRAMNDTTISGKFIPKDTEIVVNFWSVFHDETIFENPDTFDPQRFLSNDGRELKKVEELIPFSYGKRACVGEILAKMELFLYFTSIMQKYKILFPEGVQVSFESTLGINLQPIQEPVLKIVNRY